MWLPLHFLKTHRACRGTAKPGFRLWTLAPQFLDVEIYNDEPVRVNFGPAKINCVMHGGYAFQEDFFTLYNGTNGAEVVHIHNVLNEDFIYDNGYVEDFVGDYPIDFIY